MHLENVNKILVCQLRMIGDVLLATPAIRLLAERFPQAELHVLTERFCAPMLENNPHIAHIWILDKKALRTLAQERVFSWRGIGHALPGIRQLLTLFREWAFSRKVARQGFDLVVDFQQLPRCRWVVAFSGAQIRLSYDPPWYNRPLYTHWASPLRGYAAMAKASVLRPLGIEWRGQRPELFLKPEEREEAGQLLHELGLRPGEVLLSVDPTHRRQARAWPLEHWGVLLALAGAARPHLKFLLLFGPGEEQLVGRVREIALHAGLAPERLLLPSNVLTLRQMAACIGHAAMHAGNCSAPRHVAVAVGVPSFTVLGATSWAWTFPAPEHIHVARELECQPCNKNACPLYPEPRCLVELPPEDVLPRLLEHLERTEIGEG
jgi:ADP-heptose:LPS heptosyltransferase